MYNCSHHWLNAYITFSTSMLTYTTQQQHNIADSKPATLFPTEEGAVINPDATDGFAITAPPTINTAVAAFEEGGGGGGLSPSSSVIAASAAASPASAASSSSPTRRKTMQEKELLKIYYQQIGPNNFPPRSEVTARWRWAIKKVRSLYRLKSFKFGFTRQRYCMCTHTILYLQLGLS